jgi:hypothetical protein
MYFAHHEKQCSKKWSCTFPRFRFHFRKENLHHDRKEEFCTFHFANKKIEAQHQDREKGAVHSIHLVSTSESRKSAMLKK